jgi:MFS family permease
MLKSPFLLLVVIYLGFISLGLPDGTLGVAWPQMHQTLGVPIGLAGTVMVVGTLLAAFSGFSSGRVIAAFKEGPVVAFSCFLTGAALLIVSQAQSFAWLIVAAVPLGLGAGAVDAAVNGFVAKHYSGRHMNWLHACWGIGATCGPLVMTQALGHASGWRGGYLVLGSVQLSLALIFVVTLPLWRVTPLRKQDSAQHVTAAVASTAAANSFAGWLSAFIFAVYVAIEATTGLWATSILVVSRGLPQEPAGMCTAAYYCSITAGRILVGTVVDRWGNRRLIAAGLVVAALGALGFCFAQTIPIAAVSLVMIGLGFAPVYPCLMHEVPQRFAPESVQVVIGRQSGAANIGGAFLPAAAGSLAQVTLEGVAWTVMAGVILLAACIRKLNRIT